MNRVIWQYWETRDKKPHFVDELYEIAERNSGVEVIQVTPANLGDYLSDIPPELFQIREIAHKADMIRSMLIYKHGGMWLDSDAIVLDDLNWVFDYLSEYQFVGFNDGGVILTDKPNVRVNCFLARPGSEIVRAWVEKQHDKFPKIQYSWTEVGTDLLDQCVINNQDTAKLLPFDLICPIKWNHVEKFSSRWIDARPILESAYIVMLSNKALETRNPSLRTMPLCELIGDNSLISDILRGAKDKNFRPPGFAKKIAFNILGIKY